MPRRKQNDSFPELLFQALRNLPWWVGPLFIAAAFLILRFGIPALIDVPQLQPDLTSPDKAMGVSKQILGKSGADFSRMAAPWATLFVSGVWVFALVAKFQRP
jgi:hypothetical protein